MQVSWELLAQYRSAQAVQELVAELNDSVESSMAFMQVCGTHTRSYLRHGLQSLHSPRLQLIAGPGCPVCVTTQQEIDWLIKLAGEKRTTLITFGDLMRVPGTKSSLAEMQSMGSDIRVVTSPLGAVSVAKSAPGRRVILTAIGFETTAPAIAATIQSAHSSGLCNLSCALLMKRLLPALDPVLKGASVDGLVCPGHVAAVTGSAPFEQFARSTGIPCTIAGFEPADILAAMLCLMRQNSARLPLFVNAYPRAVKPLGNEAAAALVKSTFATTDARWRGLGNLAGTGYRLRARFARFSLSNDTSSSMETNSKRCMCGRILLGQKKPPDCPSFGDRCVPAHPIGPCMVSQEGTCAAYYAFGVNNLRRSRS